MVATGGIIAAAAAAQAARRRRILEAASLWKTFVDPRGMHFQDALLSWAHEQLPRADGAVDGIAVSLQLDPGAEHSVVLALPAGMLGGHLEVRREALLQKLGKLFGSQDIQLGDEPFDRAYLVKATTGLIARAVLVPAVRAEMQALGADGIAYDDGTEHGHRPLVALSLPGVRHTPEVLDRALKVVVQVARARDPGDPYR